MGQPGSILVAVTKHGKIIYTPNFCKNIKDFLKLPCATEDEQDDSQLHHMIFGYVRE